MEVECLTLKDLTSPRKTFGLRAAEEDESQSEQKENVCLEWRKSADAPSALLLNRKGAAPELTHITPIKHGALSEPWTPTANLKMLISAASPDIRDREMKKVLFRPMENDQERPVAEEEDAEAEDDSQFDGLDEDDAGKKPSRKQKSLGLLCQKFLALYPDYPPPNDPIWISLDKVATSLGVERRRIYDIVNVLESLMIVGRMAKNSYTWYGRRRLEDMLKELQSRGREQGYHLHMEPGAEARDGGASREEDPDAGNSNRKDKSLRIMSQKFVMLFLVSKTQTVTLDAAAKILIEDSQDSTSHSKYKTKVRRLYDIANVLTSLGLIKKVHVREERGRKPAFKWLGPTEFSGAGTSPPSGPEAAVRVQQQDLNRLKLARHSSFSVTPTSAAVQSAQRQVNSAPASPQREPAAVQNQPVDYSRKSTVCRLQFGNSSDTPSPAPQPTLLMRSLRPTPVSPPQPHCLAYLPSLSQPSVVMLYRAAHATPQGPEGQRSPQAEGEEARKRKRDGEEEEEWPANKKGVTGAEMELQAEDQKWTSESTQSPVSESQPSHYLYVPNSAGLNSLNFLLSSAHSAATLSLPSASVPTLAVPYVLLPSSSLQAFAPLIGSPLRTPASAESHPAVSFGLPPGGQFSATPPSPEQTWLCGASTPSARATEPKTPCTPKENMASAASKSFFQTPADSPSAAPNARKRGSAQRRLDVGHPPSN